MLSRKGRTYINHKKDFVLYCLRVSGLKAYFWLFVQCSLLRATPDHLVPGSNPSQPHIPYPLYTLYTIAQAPRGEKDFVVIFLTPKSSELNVEFIQSGAEKLSRCGPLQKKKKDVVLSLNTMMGIAISESQFEVKISVFGARVII